MPMGAPTCLLISCRSENIVRGIVRTRVTRVGLAYDIGGKGANGGDGDVVCLVWGKSGHDGRR